MANNKRVTSICLPNSIVARSANKSAAHRALVYHAIKHALKPVLPDPDKTESFVVNLVGDLEARLNLLSEQYQIPPLILFGALANAGFLDLQRQERSRQKNLSEAKDDFASALLLDPDEEHRAPQQEFWMKVAHGLASDRILLGEASTGVGKGRVIVSAAVMSVRQGKGPVIIAAPTLKILGQLWAEFMSPPVQATAADIRAAILPGRQEFVDDIALKTYLREQLSLLDEPPQDPAVSAWVEAGGPCETGGMLAQAALRHGHPLCWTMEDLRNKATQLRAEDFALTEQTDRDSEAAQQLLAIRQAAQGAHIIFCTHTMLCIGASHHWNPMPMLLPPKDDDNAAATRKPVFLIDEGHLLEAAMSSVNATALSFASLRFRIRLHQRTHGLGPTSACAKAVKTINSLIATCALLRDEDRIRIDQGGGPALVTCRNQLTRDINALHKELSTKTLSGIKGLKADLDCLQATLKSLADPNNEYNAVYLSFSPDRRFPSLQVGATSVSNKMGHLWNTATGGAAIISASFYAPDTTGRMTCDYIRSTLALPILRMDTPPPLTWEEIYSPTLHLPTPSSAPALVPDSNDPARWCDAQAALIVPAVAHCQGGALVLCTSYTQIATLQAALIQAGLDPQRLVIHQGHLADGLAQFKALHAQGIGPVWLALGAAWTGLDVRESNDIPADQDTLLEQLFITRIPLGLNRSNTMQSRMDRIGYRPVAQEAYLTLKQGLGRPIRRAGLKNRHIWMLDGRLLAPSNRFMTEIATGIFAMTTKYKKRVFF